MAELGFVADGANSYQLWLGGSPGQSRIARTFLSGMKIQKLEETFEPIFHFFATTREEKESFGDFAERVGFEAIHEYMKSYDPKKLLEADSNSVATVSDDMGAAAGQISNGNTPEVAQISNGNTPEVAQISNGHKPGVAQISHNKQAKIAQTSHGVAQEIPEADTQSIAVQTVAIATSTSSRQFRPRVSIDERAFKALQEEAEKRGLTLSELASEAILSFIQ